GIGGKVLEFRTSEDRDYTLMDPSNAYPKKELKGWRRHIILERPVITVILDEIKSEKDAEIETRFHSACSTEIRDGYVLLKGDKGTMALIPIVDGDYYFREGKHPYLPVQKNATFEWIPYFGTVTKAVTNITQIASIILPVENEDETFEIISSLKRTMDDSGNLTLFFIKNGKTYTYVFNKEKDGLVYHE
ncbi:MAG: hypothetical protein KAU83_02480, partial [Bacteroidales bacterium]|nr:hypothetical protein [Bacteroidales bacterium]